MAICDYQQTNLFTSVAITNGKANMVHQTTIGPTLVFENIVNFSLDL